MTTQTMDTVYLDGSEYWTYAEPLYSLPGLPKFMAGSTANQRGYDATWSIVADKLFLVALAGTTYNSSERGLAMVFPGCSAPVFADWFCGTMAIQNGRIVQSPDFIHLFENQVTLTFSSGRVVSQEVLRRKYAPEALLDPPAYSSCSGRKKVQRRDQSVQCSWSGSASLGRLAILLCRIFTPINIR